MNPEEMKLMQEILALANVASVKEFREKNSAILEKSAVLSALLTGRISELAGFSGDRAVKSAERTEATAGERAGKMLITFRRDSIVTTAINNALAKLREVNALPFAGTIVVRFESHGTGSKATTVKVDPFISANIPDAAGESYVSHPEVSVSFRAASTDETGKIVKRKREKLTDAERKARKIADRKNRLAATFAKRMAALEN